MNVGSIGHSSAYDYTNMHKKLSSGKRINSAADDAAGLAIANQLTKVINGTDRGTSNAQDMSSLMYTAEGSMNSITDGLQRIRDLSIEASNGTLNKSDKQIIQNEIDQILSGITDSARYAEFNEKPLLDGSFKNVHTASSQDGSGMDVSLGKMSLDALGLSNYDVTGNFDIETIDKAISMVTESRTDAGAYLNRLDFTVNANNIAYENQADARSRIEDLDIAKGMMDYNSKRTLEQYNYFSQKRLMQEQYNYVNMLA